MIKFEDLPVLVANLTLIIHNFYRCLVWLVFSEGVRVKDHLRIKGGGVYTICVILHWSRLRFL